MSKEDDGLALPQTVDCIVIGGVADGLTVKNVRSNADYIRLSRPTAIKPLARSDQTQPEIEKETDIYKLHVLVLQEKWEDQPQAYGLLIEKSQTLPWGFERLLIHYAKSRVEQLREENRQSIVH